MNFFPKGLTQTSAVVVVVLGVALGVSAYTYTSVWFDALRERTSLNRLSACMNDAETVLLCGRTEVRNLLEKRKGSEVMALLTDELNSSQCHTIGHIVGQEVYKKNQDVERAIAECGYGCTSSCMHGIIGAALIEEVGIVDESVDPRHLDPEFIRSAGAELCKSRGMCHGVGHILFQIYNEFDESLAICKEISRGGVREHCYRGVFMEHADTISTHNVLLGTERTQLRDPNSLAYPCDSVAAEFQHSCFRYLPRIQSQMIADGLLNMSVKDASKKACESLQSTRARSACFEGYGFAFHESVWSRSNTAHEVCDNLSDSTDNAACTLGIIYPVADFGDISLALSYCGGVSDERARSVCYHAVFETVRYRGTEPQTGEWTALCDKTAGATCIAEVQDYLIDPWDTVFGVRVD